MYNPIQRTAAIAVNRAILMQASPLPVLEITTSTFHTTVQPAMPSFEFLFSLSSASGWSLRWHVDVKLINEDLCRGNMVWITLLETRGIPVLGRARFPGQCCIVVYRSIPSDTRQLQTKTTRSTCMHAPSTPGRHARPLYAMELKRTSRVAWVCFKTDRNKWPDTARCLLFSSLLCA